MESVAKNSVCAVCEQEAWSGLLFVHPPAQRFAGADASSLCAKCFYKRGDTSEFVVVLYTRGGRGVGSEPAKRFGVLLETARVFWGAYMDGAPYEADEVFPTLRLAHKIGEQGAGRFLYRNVYLADVVQDVPILRQTNVNVSAPQTSLQAPSENYLVIQIGAHRQAVTAKEIARAYRQSLEAAGEPWGGKGGRYTYGFHGDSLQVEVARGNFSTQDDGSSWPTPRYVGKHVKALLEEFAEDLQLRKRGGDMKPKNLTPAMVVHLLSSTRLNNPFTFGTSENDRKEINQLLDEHIFCGDSHDIPAKRTQIWQNANKVAKMEDLYSPGPMRLS